MRYNIDLRCDSATKPTSEMQTTMFNATVGNDVFEEDPTVQQLQTTIAEYFGKESALFFPSGTMSNLTAILSWCNKRGSEIILGNKSHMFLFEQGGAAQFGGVSFHTVQNKDDGTMILEDIVNAIRKDDIHEPSTELIAIENTHNACGGKVLPKDFFVHLKIGLTGNFLGFSLMNIDDLRNPDKLDFILKNSSNSFGENMLNGINNRMKIVIGNSAI